MDADGTRARLQAWRAQGADRLDPLRFAYLEALAGRAPRHAGQARSLLEERLAVMLDAYARDLERAGAPTAAPKERPEPGALGGLLAHMERTTQRVDAPMVAGEATAACVELPVLGELRAVWSQLRNESQLRESLEQLPADAGPLNSDMLVHRALQLMQATAPGYLQQFIAYADTLASLQQLRDATAGGATPAAASMRRPARARTRKRAG